MTDQGPDLEFLLPPMSYRELAMATYDLAYRCDDPSLMSEFIALAGRCLRFGEEADQGGGRQQAADRGAPGPRS